MTTQPQETTTSNVTNVRPITPAAKKPEAKVQTVKPATVSNKVDAGGLIKQSAVIQMQQDAAGVPPAAIITQKGETMEVTDATPVVVEVPKNVFERSKFNYVFVSAMFTLNLGDDRFFDTKSELSAVTIDDGVYNLYSPFRKAGKKVSETEAPAEGVLRSSIDALLDITDEVNNSKIMLLGLPEDAKPVLEAAIAGTCATVQALFPMKPNVTIFDIIEEDEEESEEEEEDDDEEEEEDEATGDPIQVSTPELADQLKFKDIIDVRSWINSPTEAGAEDVHNVMIDFVINAGAFYDATERTKYLKQVETVLGLIDAQRPEGKTNLLLAVNLSSSQLSDAGVREFLGVLLDDEGYILYTRAELHKWGDSDWLPSKSSDIDDKLLSGDSDLLLVKQLSSDTEEPAEVTV
jgi:hypothetical protein